MNIFSPIPEAFFAENGLTATSANHIANRLKAKYQRLENDLESINCVEETLTVIGSDKENVSRKAILYQKEDIIGRIAKIARYKGFIAYLREAIKCKQELSEEINDYESIFPEMPMRPIQLLSMTKDDVISAMPIGERIKYLTAEAKAATYGKYIHPHGILDAQRKCIFEAVKNPTQVASVAGRDTVIIKHKSEISPDEIDELISNLQFEYRKSEAECNGYKHDIDEKVKSDAQQKLDDYRHLLSEYEKAVNDYNCKVEQIKASDEQERINRRKVVEALKIVIPNSYKDLYDEVNG